MRKKSHILLAKYLADQMVVEESLQSHRKAFCLGSILPDIKPSFVTKRHEFFGTFGEIQEKIEALVDSDLQECNARVYWRHFGEVIHYLADYFTFPHNRTYTGSLVEHNHYEKILKNNLKNCIKSGEARKKLEKAIHFNSLAEITSYIKERHAFYLSKLRNVEDDIRYILNVCFQVIQGIICLCTGSQLSAPALQA